MYGGEEGQTTSLGAVLFYTNRSLPSTVLNTSTDQPDVGNENDNNLIEMALRSIHWIFRTRSLGVGRRDSEYED